MASMCDTVSKVIAGQLRAENELIETYCEKMLTDPRGYGVKVTQWPGRIEVELSPDVPFGEVHTYQQ